MDREFIIKNIMLFDDESNMDKKINNCIVQAGEAASGSLVIYKYQNLNLFIN